MKPKLVVAVILLFASFPSLVAAQKSSAPEKPNILWLFQEDLSPWLGCYGYEIQQGKTPTLDAMAASGVRFSRAYVPAPVCSICRSAIITGANQIRFGAHEHRSRRGEAELPLPTGMQTIPELMREQANYFCFNVGKTDYNFEHSTVYQPIPKSNSKYPWRECPKGQPFFGQIQLKGGKINTTRFADKTDPAQVTVPADYPQNQLYREVVAQHFDAARVDDQVIAGILDRLAEDGLRESTIVVYFSDHGANHLVRHKQQPTEGGSHVPFIITGPQPWVPAASVRDDLVSMLDLSATTLSWAGVPQPAWMEGQDLFDEKLVPREFVATARDRCDQTIDRIRSLRTERFRYTRNYLLDRVLLQPQYRDNRPPVQFLRTAYADGKLADHLQQIYFGERPAEEFYDVLKDPAQVHNLVDDPKFAEELDRHRKLMDGWLAKGDTGEGDEPEIELRMADNKKWGQGVNAEYEVIRTDEDGDGLSSEWETLQQRDPNDGHMDYRFDCGGWQTEGWTSTGDVGNIAGLQGTLDFVLLDGKGSLVRKQLQLDPQSNSQLSVKLKVTQPVQFEVLLNGQSVGQATAQPGGDWKELKLPIPHQQAIQQMELKMRGEAATRVMIDSIQSGM